MTKRTIKSCSVKTLAICLSVLMIFYLIPATAYASLFEATEVEPVVSETSEHTGEIFEDVSRREENVKHFRLEDGTYIAAQYDTAVHALDENGEWQDIDNTLSESGSEYSTSNARIKFSKKITGNESIFTLHENNRKITLSLDGAIKKTTGVANNTETEFDETATTLQKMITLDRLSSRIIYEDILDGVDLEYIVVSNNVKENIIVKEQKDAYSYSFTLELNNLSASLSATGDIEITDPDSGEILYIIPAPVVYDANMTYASETDAYYTLETIGQSKYCLTITANAVWMNASDRAFPVTIDPAIYHGGYGMQQMCDTCVSQNYPTSVYGSRTYLKVGYDSANANLKAYVAMRSLPTLPAGSMISKANLNLTYNGTSEGISASNPLTLVAKKIIRSGYTSLWTESSTTYNTAMTYGKVLDYNKITSATSGNVAHWDITSAVVDWYADSTSNQGIAIMQEDMTDTAVHTVQFHSSDSTTIGTGYMPFFTISYVNTIGVESYYSYQSASAGLAGNGYVNLATGNLVFDISTLTTTDSLMPFTPSLIYNSAYASKWSTRYTKNVPYSYTSTPYGFMMNVNQTIVPLTRTTASNGTETYYVYTDSDGTEHAFFASTVSGETNIYYDEDGLNLKLTVNTNSYVIEDSSYTKYTFTKQDTESSTIGIGGYLTTITDVNGNKLNINCNTYGRPTSFSLSPNGNNTITQLNVYYNTSGTVKYILNSASQQAVLFYYSDTYNGTVGSSYKYLRKIVYAHQSNSTSLTNWDTFYSSGAASTITSDAECYYDYDSSGRLLKIRDSFNKREIQYTYDTLGRVTAVSEYGITASGALSLGQTVTITYGIDYTSVRTSGNDDIINTADDIITTYSFDKYGRCVSNYSTDVNGLNFYGAASGEYVSDNEKAKNSIKSSYTVADITTNYLANGDFSMFNTSGTPLYWTATSGVTYLPFSSNNTGAPYYNDDYYDTSYNVRMTSVYGSSRYLSQTVALLSGTYTLSASVVRMWNSDVTVTLRARSLDNSSNNFSSTMKFRKELTPEEDAEASLTFEVSQSGLTTERFVISIEVKANTQNAAGDYIDVKQLTLAKALGNSAHNKVNYGSFESSLISSGTAVYPYTQFWTVTGSATTVNSLNSNTLPTGTSLKVTGTGIGNTSYVSQTVFEATQSEINAYISTYSSNPNEFLLPSKQYRISGRALAENALPAEGSSFGIRAKITYMNPSGAEIELEEKYTDTLVSFNSDISSMQFASGIASTIEGLFVKKIEIICEFNNQTGTAYFDDIAFVYIGTDTNFAVNDYYENTALLKSTTSGYNSTWYTYEGNDIKTVITPKSYTEYIYESSPYNHRIKQIKVYHINGNRKADFCGYTDSMEKTLYSTTTYAYNSCGMVLATMVTSNNDTIITYSEYNVTPGSHIFGARISETDALGQITHYFYDSNKGYLLAVIYPDNTGVTYTYDDLGRMLTALPATGTSSSYTAESNTESVEYEYTAGLLTSVTTDSTTYKFSYDVFGNSSAISVGSQNLASYTYYPNNGKLKTLTYGNGSTLTYEYDALDRVSKICYNGNEEPAYEYKYDSNGNLYQMYDHVSNQVTTYRYDVNGLLAEYFVNDADNQLNQTSITNEYDPDGKLVSQQYYRDYNHDGNTLTLFIPGRYSYQDDNRLSSYIIGIDPYRLNITYSYDLLGRTIDEKYKFEVEGEDYDYGYTRTYSYFAPAANRTSLRISSVTNDYTDSSITDEKFTYTYDDVGNITHIYVNNSLKYSYEYDNLGQLTRENNADTSRTYVYTYDYAGNIKSKKIYGYTTATTVSTTLYDTINYSYDSAWGDKLTAYDGVAITYDTIGNPLTYYTGSASYTMTWTQGRRLATMSGNGQSLSFTYNADGIRTSKTVNGITHYYHLAGTQILSEEWTDANEVQHLIIYHYDANGQPVGMSYRNSTDYEGTYDSFLFVKNLQGDIIKVLDNEGNLLVSYTYDAWGNPTSTTYSNGGASTAAIYNPFRYRGYYYDSETGLYYLNSRYYNPTIGRFLNADIYISTGQGMLSYNMFAYCNNNPVMYTDHLGDVPGLLILAAILLFATPVGGTAAQTTVSIVSYAGMAMSSIWDKDIRADMNAIKWNPFNSNEDVVLSSNKVSFYKGVPVFLKDQGRSGSFYAISLNKNRTTIELKHERGHNWQAMMMGVANYGLLIGVPSFFELSERSYYSRPWEISAEQLGNTGNLYPQKDINRGYWYLAVSSLWGLPGYLFLFDEYSGDGK